MPIRPATRADIPIMANVLAAAFGPDPFFKVMFPHMAQYPRSFVQALRENLWVSWYDYHKVLMVAYEDEPQESDPEDPRQPLIRRHARPKQIITGMAEWERVGKGWTHAQGAWGWFDPRRIVKPILAGFYRVRRWLFRNKAAAQATPDQPNPLTLWNFVGRTKPLCTAFYEAPHRQVHWALEILAVDPAHQAKGVGRDLVAWGMARAKCDPAGDLPVVVTAADGKEGFYQKVGFKDLVGYVSKTVDEHGNDNALRAHGVGGGAVLWTK